MWHKGTLTRGLTDRSAPIVSPEISPTNAHPASIGYESRSPLQLTSSSTSALSVAQGCPILNPSEDDIRFQCVNQSDGYLTGTKKEGWRTGALGPNLADCYCHCRHRRGSESQFSTETFHSKDRVQTTRMNGRSKAAETMTQQIDPAVLARTYIQRADDYTVNALNSFSFGNATPSGKVKPRSDSQDDDEGISPTAPVDITPRPSVVHAEAVPTMVSPPKALTNCSSSPPSSSASEAESDSRIANAPSTVRPPHASPGGRGREDIEFSSDDDMFDLDHYDEYSDVEDDGQGDHIEISSARFSVSTESGPPGGFRDREGSVATLKMQRQAPEAADIGMVSELPASVPIFTSPFAAPSIAAVAPNDTSSIGADADFDFAYILGADLSADPSSVPDFVRRASVTSPQNRDQSHFPPPRKDSKSFLFSWLPTFAGRRPSTATVASTNSNANMMFMHDDTFDKELLKWGGDGYREQRKYWTFRRDAHTGSSAGKSQTNSSRDSPGKEGKDETRTRLRNLSNAPRLSTTTLATSAIDASPSNGVVEKELVVESYKEAVYPKEREEKEKERDKDKTKEREKEKDRVRRSTRHWRGMDIGSEEIWNNDLLGSFNVSREEAGNKAPGAASESTKGPQQRLLIRFRPSTSIPAPASPSSPSKAIMFKPTFAEPHLHLPHPPITVHKHSKAMAFSLTRYYRYSPSNAGRGPAAAGHMNMTGSGLPSKTPRPQNPRAPSSRIILLAPRKVQEAFTSTTTTKMLADHGLLGDKEHERDKDRRRKSLGGESSKSKSSVSIAPPDKVRRKRSVASSLEPSSTVIPPVPPLQSPSSRSAPLETASTPITSTNMSPAHIPPASSTTTIASVHTDSADHTDTDNSTRSIPHNSSTLFESSSSRSETTEATSASDASTTSDVSSRLPPRRRGPRRKRYHETDGYSRDHNEGESDTSSVEEDNGWFGNPSRTVRTPHNETYGTVDFSTLDRQRALHLMSDPTSSSPSSSSPFSFLDRLTGKPRKGVVVDSLDPSASALRATAGPAYDPPWLTFPSRGKQEQQRRVVDNLNMSFKDVGLLPSTPKDPHGRLNGGASSSGWNSSPASSGRRKSIGGAISGKGKSGKKDKGRTHSPSRDVFSSVPREALCMLLPLWPGETDGPSVQQPFRIPPIPLEQRTFLLVWYKDHEPQIASKEGGGGGGGGGVGGTGGDDVALSVIDSLIGLTPEKERDKKEKEKRHKGTSSGSGKESGKSSRASPVSSNDSSGGFLRSSRSLGLGIGGGGGTGSGHRSATSSRDNGHSSAPHLGSFHSPHSNVTWAQLHANDDRNILLPGFKINARRVSYYDLQGTGVRVPDEGLAVNGSLAEAWRDCDIGTMSSDLGLQPFLDPTLLAVCHSRESGVEFDPEALVSLGLCQVLNPLPMGMVAEDFMPFSENNAGINVNANGGGEGGKEGSKTEWGMTGMGLKRKLTPVGRAAVEMCWAGGLALTSFRPG